MASLEQRQVLELIQPSTNEARARKQRKICWDSLNQRQGKLYLIANVHKVIYNKFVVSRLRLILFEAKDIFPKSQRCFKTSRRTGMQPQILL